MIVHFVSKKSATAKITDLAQADASIYYLSQDYKSLTELRNSSTDSSTQTLGKEFHSICRDFKDSYLDIFRQLYRNNKNNKHLWSTPLFSRNSAEIPLQRLLVYFVFFKQQLCSSTRNLIFIYDDTDLLHLMKNYCDENKVAYTHSFSFLEKLSCFRPYLKILHQSIFFLKSSFSSYIYFCFHREKNSLDTRSEYFLIRSWYTKGCLTEGVYRDRNFGPLLDTLKKKNIPFLVSPMFFNLEGSLVDEFRKVSSADTDFLIPEQHLSLLGYFQTCLRQLRAFSLSTEPIILEDCDISSFVRNIHRKSFYSADLLQHGLFYQLMRQLKSQLKIKSFTYPFENNTVEKTMLLAMKDFFPQSQILAFQHSVWYKEQYSMQLYENEENTHLMPDQIICSANIYPSVLSLAGFPLEKMKVGGNLRFSDVNNISARVEDGTDKNNLLIVLNFEWDTTFEILQKLKDSFEFLDDQLDIVIKPHPLQNEEVISAYLEKIDFPPFKWASGKVTELVAESSAVVMPCASVSNLETLVIGVPLIRVSLDNNFDFDPLWMETEFAPLPLSNPIEIAESIRRFLGGPSQQKQMQELSGFIIENYFTEASEELILESFEIG